MRHLRCSTAIESGCDAEENYECGGQDYSEQFSAGRAKGAQAYDGVGRKENSAPQATLFMCLPPDELPIEDHFQEKCPNEAINAPAGSGHRCACVFCDRTAVQGKPILDHCPTLPRNPGHLGLTSASFHPRPTLSRWLLCATYRDAFP